MPTITKVQGVAEILAIEKKYAGRQLSDTEKKARRNEKRKVYKTLNAEDADDIKDVRL